MSIPYQGGGKLADYIKDTDLPLLGSNLPVIFEDGNWSSMLVEFESQVRAGIDPWSCVSYSALTCLEMYAKVQNIDINKSDKFTAVMSGTRAGVGNSFRNVSESIKRDWTVDEAIYPYTDSTLESYYRPVPEAIKQIALADKPNWTYFYRYPATAQAIGQDPRTREEVIVDALKYTPLQISLKYPTKRPVRGVYEAEHGENHAVVLINYSWGKWWEIFDSYDPQGNGGIKRLAWDYPIYGVVSHTIEQVSSNRDVILRDYRGKLIKNANSPKVYHVDKMGQQIVWIENEEKFHYNRRQGWHGGFDTVLTINIPIQEDLIF
jgi:hypothetical protein